MRRKLVVFGTGQIAEVVAFYFDRDSEYEIVAFTVDSALFAGSWNRRNTRPERR